MSRGRSGHGGVNILSSAKEFMKGIKAFVEAVSALDPEHGSDEQKVATKQDVLQAVGRVRPVLQAFDELERVIDAGIAFDVDYGVKVTEAENRLTQIATTMRALEERLAVLLKEEDRVSAELATRRQELATADAGMAKYRATVAAL